VAMTRSPRLRAAMAICFPKPEEQPVMSQTLALGEVPVGVGEEAVAGIVVRRVGVGEVLVCLVERKLENESTDEAG